MDTEEQWQWCAGYVLCLFSYLRRITSFIYIFTVERVKQPEVF